MFYCPVVFYMWLLGWDVIYMLKGEKVSFDPYLGYMVSWVCVKVKFFMPWWYDALCGYIYEIYVKLLVMLRSVCYDMVKAC